LNDNGVLLSPLAGVFEVPIEINHEIRPIN